MVRMALWVVKALMPISALGIAETDDIDAPGGSRLYLAGDYGGAGDYRHCPVSGGGAPGPPADRQLQQESERLALLFEAARDEAIARSEPVAWSHFRGRHQFWIRKNADWQPLTGVDVLVPRELPTGISFGSIKVNLQPQGEDGKLVFQPSGVNELFQVQLLGEGGLFELASDVLGRVRVSRQDVAAQG
jgi:general secretion pathway protein H